MKKNFFQKKKKVVIIKNLWNKINTSDFSKYQGYIKYLLKNYGTKEPCNRFDIGNCIEFSICDFLKDLGFSVKEMPNSKKVDLCLNNIFELSIKYSSGGDIKIHNSNGSINKDYTFSNLLLLTPKKLYLLTNENINEKKIDLQIFLKNTGDGLQLKRSILKHLEEKKFEYVKNIDLTINKQECKNKLCSKLYTLHYM